VREALLGGRRRAIGRIEQDVGILGADAAHDFAVELGSRVEQVAAREVASVEVQDRRAGRCSGERILD
jgi:hypothetical protein